MKIISTLLFIYSCIQAQALTAAEYSNPSSKKNASISLQNAKVVKNTGADEYYSMFLVAKDKKPLYEGQIYRLKSLELSAKNEVDAIYDEEDEIIFISELEQAEALRHQTTLQLLSSEPMEFIVVEKTTSVIQIQQPIPDNQQFMYTSPEQRPIPIPPCFNCPKSFGSFPFGVEYKIFQK